MTIEEQFTELVEKHQEDEMIVFLKGLDPGQRKQLGPLIKKNIRHYGQFVTDSSGKYDTRGSRVQTNMLQVAAFICLNQADYERTSYSVWILREENIKKVIDWYIPEWFSDFVNKQAKGEFLPYFISYEWAMNYMEKDLLQPSRELIAKTLPAVIFENDKANKWVYKPEALVKRKITLEEHIWILFDEPSSIHYSDRFLFFGNEISKEKRGWVNAFKQFSEEGKIDRQRLLKEALLASNKNFNKVLSGWFINLFAELNPTKEEIQSLQSELFSLLSSPNSKVVNDALQFIRQLVKEPDFEISNFLDAVPVLLSSDTKGTVTAALGLLDILAKNFPQEQQKIVLLTCHTFIHADDSLQTKAARIIVKYAKKEVTGLQDELKQYWPGILHSAREILQKIAGEPESNLDNLPKTIETAIVQENKFEPIAAVDTIDDLFFLASQAFDNNASWHFDFLPAFLTKFQNEIKGANISRLEPALQRALKFMNSGPQANMGSLDHMLAVFFIDCCIHLVRKYPEDAEVLKKLFAKFDQKDGDIQKSWLAMEESSTYIETWDNYYAHDPFYLPFKFFLQQSLKKITAGSKTPLLSTPTHQPGWLSVRIFAERLHIYQKEGAIPFSMDIQLAVSRCKPGIEKEEKEFATKYLTGEYKDLLLYILGDAAIPAYKLQYPEAWLVAFFTKRPKQADAMIDNLGICAKTWEEYTGQLPWETVEEDYKTQRYNYEKRKYEEVTDRRKILRILSPAKREQQKPTGIKKLLTKILPENNKKNELVFLYDYFTIKSNFFDREHNDVRRIFLMMPNNPESFLAPVIRKALKYPTFFSESDKKFVIALLQLLHETWDDFGEMAHLFLATSMISSDKTAANIAAEIWVKATNAKKIDHVLLGKIIGIHQRIEFAPFKRFTDLFLQSMFKISPLHNQSAQIILENILAELPEEPVKNLKKLLEVYSELLNLNAAKLTDSRVQKKLECWQKNTGLSKLAKSFS